MSEIPQEILDKIPVRGCAKCLEYALDSEVTSIQHYIQEKPDEDYPYQPLIQHGITKPVKEKKGLLVSFISKMRKL